METIHTGTDSQARLTLVEVVGQALELLKLCLVETGGLELL